MTNDYMIKSVLFQQADVTFYTTKDKINKHLHFDSATLLVLLLNGAAFPAECQRTGTLGAAGTPSEPYRCTSGERRFIYRHTEITGTTFPIYYFEVMTI